MWIEILDASQEALDEWLCKDRVAINGGVKGSNCRQVYSNRAIG